MKVVQAAGRITVCERDTADLDSSSHATTVEATHSPPSQEKNPSAPCDTMMPFQKLVSIKNESSGSIAAADDVEAPPMPVPPFPGPCAGV